MDNIIHNMLFLLNDRLTNGFTSHEDYLKYWTKFIDYKTIIKRFNLVYKTLKINEVFPEFKPDLKDDRTSFLHRTCGNEQYASCKYLEALKCHTRSVATAKTQEVASLAYANRSACLLKLSLYQNCLEDIERALVNCYSETLKQKLLIRKQEALEHQELTEAYHEQIPEIFESQKNPLIQCASDAIRIEENEEYGRHIVATRDIKIGEVLTVERAYSCVVLAEQLIHCHHCLELCYNPIPCNYCSKALYCSEDCKEKAQTTYHKYECKILHFLTDNDLDFTLVALRVAFSLKNEFIISEFDKNKYYRSDSYEEFFRLKSNEDKLFKHDLHSVFTTAALIYHLLKTNTDFFDNVAAKRLFKEKFTFQLLAARFNGTRISEFTKKEVGYCHEYFACGVYNFFALFNHSCVQNCDRYMYGSTMVIRAEWPIKKGEQCFVNYGLPYTTFSKEKRQMILGKNYFFECKCKACEEDWKVDPAMMSQLVYFTTEHQKKYFGVEASKRILPIVIQIVEQRKEKEPNGVILLLRKIISDCFDSFGNKRKI